MDEDDMDFTPTHSTSSKLASLFGINKSSSAENPSLIYTPPKQPKKEASPNRTPPNEANKSNKLEIILAKGVQAYKLENGSYISQGTVGITIIGSYAAHIYQIIIYNGNKQHISKTRISRNFLFTISDNNYASFYDDARVNWSVMFNSSGDIQQFAKQIAISKFNSQGEPLSDALIQDLSPVSSLKVQVSNSVDVSYTYSIITNDEIGQPKEKLSKSYQITENSDIPWLKGLIGCGEKCKRAIVLPYSLSAPWTSQIPQSSNIIIEVEVEKIHTGEVSPSPKPKAIQNPAESPVDSSAEESTIKARGVCIKEALSTTKSHKANLISRMARMGQATLPLKGAIPCGPSDSEEESSISSSPKAARISRVRAATTLPTVQPSHVQEPGPINQSVAVYQNDLSWQQPQLIRSGVPMPYQQIIPVSTTPMTSPSSDTAMSVYFSESRTQATELRMGITKVSDKVDQVLNKLQTMNVNSSEQIKTSQTPVMDPTGLLSSIQALVTENENLKSKVEEQKGKIEQQNDRIFHLLELNHKYLEKNSASETEKEQVKTQIESDSQKKIYTLQKELSTAQDSNKNLQEEIATLRESNKNLHDEISTVQESHKKIQEEIAEIKSKDLSEEKDSKIKKLETEILELTESKKKLEEQLSTSNKSFDVSKTEFEKTLESHKSDLESLRIKNEELQAMLENQKVNVVDDDKARDREETEKLRILIKQLTDEKQILTSKLQERKDLKDGNDSFVDDLKRVMNGTYGNLKAKLEDDQEYLGSKVKMIIGSTIRDVTLEYLEMKQQNKPQTAKPVSEDIKKETTQQETKKVDDKKSTVEKQAIKPIENKSIEENPIIKTNVSEDIDQTQVITLKLTTEETVPVKEAQKEPETNLEAKPSEESELLDDSSPKDSKTKLEGEKESYDQNWRTNKPPPVPLFEDDDDEDDWLK